jgi:hypothetical protein
VLCGLQLHYNWAQQAAAELRHSSGAEIELRKIPRETFPSTFFAGGDSSSRTFSGTASADSVAGGLYDALSPPTLFAQYAAAERSRNATLSAPVHAAAVSVLHELLGTTANNSRTAANNSSVNNSDSSSSSGASPGLTSVHTSLVLDTVKLINFGPFHEEVRYCPLLWLSVTLWCYCTALYLADTV